MELSGKLFGITKDFITGKFIISLQIDQDITESYKKLEGVALDISVDKHREKRSLDANAYFHVLVGKIAEAMNISKPRCKNIMIGRYGQIEYIDDQPVMIKTQIPADDMLEQENLHCLPCGGKTEPNGLHTYFYWVYRGSRTYNTAEMSRLIDGTVSEAKDHGIETMTPEQLLRLKSLWKVKENG